MTTIPIQETQARNQYLASAAQTTFPFTFWISAAEDISVYVNDALQTLNTDYSVSGILEVTGGSVIFVNGLDENDVVTLSRQMPLTRVSEFQTGGTFKAEVLNLELSKMIAMMQQLQRDLTRSVKLPVVSGANAALLTLPEPQTGSALIWGENTLENGPDAAQILAAAANAQAASEAADIATTASNAAQAAVGGVRISANDSMADNLEKKLLAGSGISLTTQNDGDNEIRTVAMVDKTPFAMAGYRGDGSFNEIFLADGLLRDNATLGVDKASQNEAETGVNSSRVMTPLRTAQAIVAQSKLRLVQMVNVNTNTATIDFTNMSANHYLLVAEGVIISVDNEFVNMRLSTDNGTSFNNTAGDYVYGGIVANQSASTSGRGSSTTATGFAVSDNNTGLGNAAGESLCFNANILNMNGQTTNPMMFCQSSFTSSSGLHLSTFYSGQFKGYGGSSVDAVRLFCSGGAQFSKGKFSLYEVVEA